MNTETQSIPSSNVEPIQKITLENAIQHMEKLCDIQQARVLKMIQLEKETGSTNNLPDEIRLFNDLLVSLNQQERF